MVSKDGKIRLSPSALNVFLECPKCFWLDQKENIHRPRGIFPSLPGGMDLVIKDYFDKYREVGKMPPEVDGKIDAELFADIELLNKWRNWRTGLTWSDPESGATLSGALDDLGINSKKLFIPLDYKTRGFPPKEGGESFYQNQLNCYGLLLRENNMKPDNYAYLIYYFPSVVSENGMVKFEVVPKRVTIDPNEAVRVLREAVEVIKGPMPKTHGECEYCGWGREFLRD
ncbi:MAG: PD-(D/E)XK nuclease family protein [Candidatus Harrisonbacteria bacterium]|nr:PD-(D/E)XK nuclease family protein [Candidatus Harrisonbacteria bacterium]